MVNLKEQLMILGNALVAQGYVPAAQVRDGAEHSKSTKPIEEFTKWVNSNPQVIECLEQLDISWPVAVKPPETFEVELDGLDHTFEIQSAIGSKLYGTADRDGVIVTRVIGESDVRERDRERYWRCVKDLGGIVGE